MTDRLLKLGADPAKLYEQFRERNEEREAQQEDAHLQAQEDLTKPITSEDFISVREYRHAREAEGRLLVESGIPLDDMTYSDYKKAREYQQRGERPRSYREHQQEREQAK